MKQVLLVDDNPIDLLINEKVLKTINPSTIITKATSANEGLEKLEAFGKQGVKIDYILLDIKMPIMNGFEFLDEFASLPAAKRESIKIIMVSSSIDPNDKTQAFENPQVVDFLEKPLQLNAVKSCKALVL